MRYRFANCELRTDSHELVVDGTVRPVEPQVFDVLRHLVEKAGQLVSQDDLIEAVWGGRIVSDSAISARISAARAAVGDNGSRQAVIRTVTRRGFRFVAEVVAVAEDDARGDERRPSPPAGQRVRFCTSRDGTRIAWASTGSGYPLVRACHWLTHLEHDWHSPLWRPILDEFGRDFRVTRYDQRGNGLSDTTAANLSLDAFVEDFEAVVEAAGLDRFAVYGASQGAPVAVAYAARHPGRVSHLVLHGGYARGRLVRESVDEREQGEALQTLIRLGWGKPGSPIDQALSTMMIPDGTKEQIASLAELQRITISAENAVRIRAAVDAFDVTGLLGQVKAPTLVLHARNDGVHPLDEGRALAAAISGAGFVMLESANHTPVEGEPAWAVAFDEIRRFVLG